MVHSRGDGNKLLGERQHHGLVDRIVHRQFDGDLQHALAEEGHPRGSIRLFQMTSRGERGTAIEYADVVESQEATPEDVLPTGVLAVHPPVEIHQQLLKHLLEKSQVALARASSPFVDFPRGPRMHRGVDVAKVPLISRKLAIRIQVDIAQQQKKLLLREVHVYHCERYGVKRQVPRRVPGVLPLVRHGDNVRILEVGPLTIPALVFPLSTLPTPALDAIVVVLLAPQHAG